MENRKVNLHGISYSDENPKVFFTCHPNDLKESFDVVIRLLTMTAACTVYYTEKMDMPFSREEYESKLGKMNLFIIPVTPDLLTTENRAMDHDFSYAVANNIPVLPIMIKSGLDQIYRRKDKFGDLPYIDMQGTDDDRTVASLASFVHIFGNTLSHRYGADVGTVKKVYEDHLAVLGEKHPNTVLCHINLGLYLREAGDCEEALKIGKEAFIQAGEVFGKIHPNTLSALKCLSEACLDSKKQCEEFTIADKAYHEYLGTSLQKYDEMSHLETCLARTYRALSDKENELRILKDRRKRHYEAYGVHDIRTAHAVCGVANALFRIGRYEEAAPVFEEGYKLFHDLFGDNVQATQNVMCNLARNLLRMGETDKAVAVCEKILDDCSEVTFLARNRIKKISSECGREDLLDKLNKRVL